MWNTKVLAIVFAKLLIKSPRREDINLWQVKCQDKEVIKFRKYPLWPQNPAKTFIGERS